MDNELDMSQGCALAATKRSRRVAWRLREEIIPLYSTPVRLHLKYCEQFWVLIVREMLTKWRESSGGAL